MKKSLFQLSFIGLLFLTTTNKTITSQEPKTISIIDQTSEQCNKNKSFFDLSISEIWKTKLKPVLQDQKFIIKLILFLGSACLLNEALEIVGIAQKMQYDNNIWNRIHLYSSLKIKAFFKVLVPSLCCTAFAFADLTLYIVKKIA